MERQKELGIPISEFQDRIEKVRHFVLANDLAGLLVYSGPRAHMWYQTGHVGWLTNWANLDRIPDSMVVIPADGDPVLLFSGLPFMLPQLRETSWFKDVRIVSSVDPNAVAIQSGSKEMASGSVHDFAGEAQAILSERGLRGKPVGLVGIEYMPVPFYEALRNGFGPDELKVTEDIVAKLRAVKSPNELRLMRRAAELSDLGYETFAKVAKPGMPGIEAIAAAEHAARSQGGEQVMYWITNCPDGSWKDSIIDIKPTPRTLNYGDQVMMCSYVVYKGYWAHGHRCGFIGKEGKELKEMWEPLFEAHCAGIEKMRPGVPAGEVVKAARVTAEKYGYSLQGGRIGHGIGVDYGERPFLSEDNRTPLEKGNVAIVHTMFSVPGADAMVVPTGDLCHVTDDGPEFLFKFQRQPFVTGG